MNGAPLAYGVDFGTSNSLISVAWSDHVQVIDVGSKRVPENLPSVIYLNADGNRAAGDQAVEQYLVSAGVNSRLLVGIKSDLSDPKLMGTSSWDRTWSLSDLVEIILRALKRAADSAVGSSVDRVVLGCPVAFVGTEGPQYDELQQLAVGRLVDAAQQAGFAEIEVLEEPAAAVQEEQISSGVVVALDFGGGTFDVAVVDYSDEDAEVIALKGADIGGELFDQLLFNSKIAPELGLHDEYADRDGKRHRLPNRIAASSRSMLDLRGLLNDPTIPRILRRFRGYQDGENLERLERLLFGGFAYQFYEAVEVAKINLSSSNNTMIDFHREGFDLTLPVTRKEFDHLISPHLDVVVETIWSALDDADVAPDNVARVVRTGGSSMIPAFVDRVSSIFGESKMQQREPFTTVVRGLASYAQGEWG
jgi:hypothetical chaperone protein